MICEELVNLTDDDIITETITENGKINHKPNLVIDTIILDDDSQITDNNNTVTIINDNEKTKSTNNIYTAVSRDNELLGTFIKKCLQIENSRGMGRVINNTLLRSYMETNKSYKNSPECMRVIRRAIHRLETTPHLKFSHVKNLSETFKLNRFKKRVKLTTLVNLTDQPEINEFTKPKTIIIDSDEEQPIINLDEDQNDVVLLDTPMGVDDEKENKSEEQSFLVSEVEVTWEPNNFTTATEKQSETPPVDMEKVKTIEKQIEYYKNLITKLEEEEVDDDSMNSPYIRCEMFKSKIVHLYSELCNITGHEAIKRKEVRLQVLEGHPEGPVRKLEQFINENIGRDGDPPFPDFYDVVNCVSLSNLDDNLGWSRQQIMKEASALFTQCGRALQMRRQKREWRDLKQRVKTEAFEDDPAERDPELLAKLNENKRIARKKEDELLERFSMMQNLPKPPSLVVPNKGQVPDAVESSFDSKTDTEPENSQHEIEKATEANIPETNKDSENIEKNLWNADKLETNEIKLHEKIENNQSTANQPKTDACSVKEIIKTDLPKMNTPQVHECLDKKISEVNEPKPTASASEKIETNLNEELEKEPKINKPIGFILTVNGPICQLVNSSLTKDPDIDNTGVVKVKEEKEPLDIINQLEQFGDNFTISVTDIEDPFLVIEVSDSSDDEDNYCDN